MLVSQFTAMLDALNAQGASTTYNVTTVPSSLPLNTIITVDPPAGERVPPDQHFEIEASDGSGAAAGVGFPSVSMFGGALQGANG